jgi:3,4-dihydroxy 2-butanone 4-phosphate synthase / GTP cyclohydrolase II
LAPAGVICEIQNPDGSMARLPDLIAYAHSQDLKIISIADLISYRLKHDRFVYREAVTKLPSQFGQFEIYGYRNLLDNTETVAIVKGDPADFKDREVMVRMHSECLTGDALGSLRCDCQLQLQAALKTIENAGAGVVVYLRQEGRGIGLINKLKAYSLQDLGFDTVEANNQLGFPADLRNYGVGAQVLNDLGVNRIRLITNNPRKIAGLKGYGLEIVDRVPLLIEANDYNTNYLATKAEKLGHMLLQTYLVTVGITWQNDPLAATERYDRLEKLRQIALEKGLLLREEARPVGTALFGNPSLTVHLGEDRPDLVAANWYQHPQSTYLKSIDLILSEIATLPEVVRLEYLLADGTDPLTGLQMQLDRHTHPDWQSPIAIQSTLDRQTIYSWTKS